MVQATLLNTATFLIVAAFRKAAISMEDVSLIDTHIHFPVQANQGPDSQLQQKRVV